VESTTAEHSERVGQPLWFRRPSPHRADLATASDARRLTATSLKIIVEGRGDYRFVGM